MELKPKKMNEKAFYKYDAFVKNMLKDPLAPQVNVYIEGEIDRKKQIDFTLDLFFLQAEKTKSIAENDYNKNPVKWLESKPIRSRWVIIEARQNNIKKLAEAAMKSSPLERITIAGLTPELQTSLTNSLRELWKEKLNTATKEYKTIFLNHFIDPEKIINLKNQNPVTSTGIHLPFGHETENVLSVQNEQITFFTDERNALKTIEDVINGCTVSELLGPHQFITDLNISEENLNNVSPHFKTNIEEIILHGESNELAAYLPALAESMHNIPYLPIKATPFNKKIIEDSLWRVGLKPAHNSLELITSGKSAVEILGNRSLYGPSYLNVEVSPLFLSSFDINTLKNKMEVSAISSDPVVTLEINDIEYLKSIFLEEAVYPANTSPDAITKTISKATSALGAKGAQAVGDALMWNMVNRPVSTARGVEFAIASMTLDGGNDLIKEALDKKTSYKAYFNHILSYEQRKGCSSSESLHIAAFELVKAYVDVEKKNKKIQHYIDEGDLGRDYGLEESNMVKVTNTKGVEWLRSLPYFFATGTALQITGMGLAIAGQLGSKIGTSTLGLSLATTGGFIFSASTAVTYLSMKEQKAANANHLPCANIGLAIANEKFYAVKQLRDSMLNELVNHLLNNNDSLIEKNLCEEEKTEITEKSSLERFTETPVRDPSRGRNVNETKNRKSNHSRTRSRSL
jgi:hypothetical protein